MNTYQDLDERFLLDALSYFGKDVRRYRESIKGGLVFYSIGCASTVVSGVVALWYSMNLVYLFLAIAAVFGFLAVRAQAMILGVDGTIRLYDERIVSVPAREKSVKLYGEEASFRK